MGPAGPPGPPVLSSFITLVQNYWNSIDLVCPAGYKAVVASCNMGVTTVIHAQTPPPLLGQWASYLTPNAVAATGVHCSSIALSQAHLRCAK
jgi:hypothetical protein